MFTAEFPHPEQLGIQWVLNVWGMKDRDDTGEGRAGRWL